MKISHIRNCISNSMFSPLLYINNIIRKKETCQSGEGLWQVLRNQLSLEVVVNDCLEIIIIFDS